MKMNEKKFDTILDIQKASISTISKEDFQRRFLKLYDRCNIVFLWKGCISND